MKMHIHTLTADGTYGTAGMQPLVVLPSQTFSLGLGDKTIMIIIAI